MAEAVVQFVLSKLANMIADKIEFLGGVEKKVERVQRDLMRIKCFLQDADSKQEGDARVQNWLNDLRNVAYRIEDVTDTFFLKIEDQRQKDPTFFHQLKKMCHKPMEVPVLNELGNELDDIQNLLEEISKSRVDYAIKPLQEKGKGEAIALPYRRATYEYVKDENEVVGLYADKNNILKLLRREETTRRAVITIVGTGGLGKTTLAHTVYRSAKADFKYHIMLSISQQFSITYLLRKMLFKPDVPEPSKKPDVPEKQDVEELISELTIFLSKKRYLIILDDVWRVDLWNQLKHALPDVQNGSRILITSRFIDVAHYADPKMAPYKLDFLDNKKSLDLLLKKAFPYQEPGEECPSDILELAEELSKICKGLPLALIVVGGILSTKEPSYPAWRRVLQTMNWQSKGKDCMQVLAMSYEDMPYYLKACFLYLASFPEDYEISAKRVVRMWAAEKFIPHEDTTTIEEMAEDCLEELFQRSMIQVTSRSTRGLIKSFQVHDILRDLAMHKARQENFVTVISQAYDINQPSRGTRRVSFQSDIPRFMEYVGPSTRSLLWFGQLLPKCSNFRLLKVLELVGVRHTNSIEVKVLEELVLLKYLGFRYCYLYRNSIFSFRRMKDLETLDLRGGPISQCVAVWTSPTLRHVLTDLDNELDGPITPTELRNLQTMKWVSASATWARKLPILNNLCKLGIDITCYNGDITKLLETLPSLISLGLKGSNLPKKIVYPSSLPNYQNLQSLHLIGAWKNKVTLEARLFPQHLIKLKLERSFLGENLMSELGKLKSLKKLCLIGNVFNECEIICPAGFPVLQYLNLKSLPPAHYNITVEQGAMPKLAYVQLHDTKWIQLHLPPELQHVTVHRSTK